MQKIADKSICNGCHACYTTCPTNCITMKPNTEGFLYPQIDKKMCINCGKCQAVCPILRVSKGNKKGQAYACINKNEDIRLRSSSGGVFTLIAEYVLNQNGVVFGAAFGDDFSVKHIEVLNKNELQKLRGSKYLQSTIGDAYKQAENYLKQGKIVLFSGTPCQISGLKLYLGKDYDNLILQDIICHGVPSPMVWQKYIKYREKIAGGNMHRINFRQKKHGWNSYSLLLGFSNNTEYEQNFRNDLFMRGFLSNLYLRPSCYKCHSKSFSRESDITLADFWGIDNVLPEMNDNKGTSLVFVNSKKGRAIFNKIAEDMIYKDVDIEKAVKYNTSAYKSAKLPKNRNKFMHLVKMVEFDKALNKAIKTNIIRRFIIKGKRILKRVLKL